MSNIRYKSVFNNIHYMTALTNFEQLHADISNQVEIVTTSRL